MSDSPCSAPAAIRHLLDMDTPAVMAACRVHDDDYTTGGDERDRLRADLRFALALLVSEMTATSCEQVYDAVRAWGASHFHYVTPAPTPAVEAP